MLFTYEVAKKEFQPKLGETAREANQLGSPPLIGFLRVLDRRAKFRNSKMDLEFWKVLGHFGSKFTFGRASVNKLDVATSKLSG